MWLSTQMSHRHSHSHSHECRHGHPHSLGPAGGGQWRRRGGQFGRFRSTERQRKMQQWFKKWGGYMCSIAVWAWIVVCYICLWPTVFVPWRVMEMESMLLSLVVIFFHILLVWVLYLYAVVINSNPGYVPTGWVSPKLPPPSQIKTA